MADTHFGHTNLQKHCDRPENADELMIDNLKKIQWRDNDIFIHLGDVCWGDDEKWNRMITDIIKARKILVRGNHDNKSLTWYHSNGWDFVTDRFDVKVYGSKIAFSHQPLKASYGFDINIHGHIHSNKRLDELSDDYKKAKRILVKSEHDYQPYRLILLLKLLEANFDFIESDSLLNIKGIK